MHSRTRTACVIAVAGRRPRRSPDGLAEQVQIGKEVICAVGGRVLVAALHLLPNSLQASLTRMRA